MTILHPIEPCGRLASASSPEPPTGQRGIVFILGAPRSGTSWLGKLFDSHPAVLYRHEPDAVLRPTGLPWLCSAKDIPHHVDAMRGYVTRLMSVRQLKASGTRPVFAKPFQPFAAPLVRRALAFGLRGAESLMPRAVWPKRVAIPDLIRGDAAGLTYVIKSVSLLGNAALLARALPKSRIIAIFRHPCGQVASQKRGSRIRTMTGGMFGSGVL
ncbi:MAG: sulfotransferase, partial [Stellaceae bacterium]